MSKIVVICYCCKNEIKEGNCILNDNNEHICYKCLKKMNTINKKNKNKWY